MSKTALTILIEWIEVEYPNHSKQSNKTAFRVLEKAQALKAKEERDQIERDYNEGWSDDGTTGRTGERYYQQTYGNK